MGDSMDIIEIFKHLNDEQKERYLKLQKTFESDGWSLLVDMATTKGTDAFSRAAYASSWEENRIFVGQHIVYESFKNLKETVDAEFEQLAAENAMESLKDIEEGQEDDVNSQS